MEPLPERLDRIVGDLDKLIQLYDYAESVYPYENIRAPASLNEDENRKNRAFMQSNTSLI